MKQEDALKTLIGLLRDPDHGNFGSYGYDIYLPYLLLNQLRNRGVSDPDSNTTLREWMPHFYAAAWELCRRGVLRPGVNAYQAQSTAGGNAGDGYSITPFGRQWIVESERDDFVPTEPERFAAMMEPYFDRFGVGFFERSQEAIRCYGAHTYLACCTMCGAASESILLAAAIAKTKDEEKILREYSGSQGRSKVERILIGQAKEWMKREYRGYTSLLKYWRDTSAHGRKSGIGDNEAYTSLALLLRFAAFVYDNWNGLTQ
ncbi:MAG: hypothetical protein KAU17_13220 [Spirochaetales bacterium]|nr:hypothetical protein [Spirochaetales bacterium]